MGTKLKFAGISYINPGKSVSTHFHSCVEIVVYLSADGETEINGVKSPIKSGDIAVVNASSPHCEHHFAKCKVLYFGIESDEELPIPAEGVYTKISGFERLHNIAERIHNEVKNQKLAHELMISANIVEFIVLFGRIINNSKKQDRSLEYCADYFRENYALQINIKELVESYGFDYERFRKDFKQKYGVAPKQFVVDQRLNHAYSMLSDGEISCTDVAMYCGFSDSSQFSKMFKKRYGISPERVRIK